MECVSAGLMVQRLWRQGGVPGRRMAACADMHTCVRGGVPASERAHLGVGLQAKQVDGGVRVVVGAVHFVLAAGLLLGGGRQAAAGDGGGVIQPAAAAGPRAVGGGGRGRVRGSDLA